MNDRELYATLLGIGSPWKVTEVHVDMGANEVKVSVQAQEGTRFACGECGGETSAYDTKVRRWRHLDTMQFKTILECAVPRCRCDKHGIHQVKVPWAEERARFTALFECLVIDLLKMATFKAVAERMGLSWDEVDGIQGRAVERGQERKRLALPKKLAVDETSFQRRHEYVTTVLNLDAGTVEWVADGRGQEALGEYFGYFEKEHLDAVEVVSMDMWGPYISATRAHIKDADRKISFDKFHVAKHLGDAVDKVRRAENRDLLAMGDRRLVGTKHWWLYTYAHVAERMPGWALSFELLRNTSLRVARAWAMKEAAMALWTTRSRSWARRGWNGWLAWAQRCRLGSMKKVGRMIANHLDGILNAIENGATNAMAEAINGRIQKVKSAACGFRNRERFRNAIYFHLGGLDLYPRPSGAHTIS